MGARAIIDTYRLDDAGCHWVQGGADNENNCCHFADGPITAVFGERRAVLKTDIGAALTRAAGSRMRKVAGMRMIRHESYAAAVNAKRPFLAFHKGLITKRYKEYMDDAAFDAACEVYAQEWRNRYICGDRNCQNRDCPQHWPNAEHEPRAVASRAPCSCSASGSGEAP